MTFTVTGELQQLQENGSQDGKHAEYVAGQRTYDKEPERRDRSARQAASRWDTTAMINCGPAENLINLQSYQAIAVTDFDIVVSY